jgi:hypothetical protein
VGETTNFRKRMNGHRSDCFKKPETATYIHREKSGHTFDDFAIVILKGDFKSEDERKKFERFAIDRFNTFAGGLNRNPF